MAGSARLPSLAVLVVRQPREGDPDVMLVIAASKKRVRTSRALGPAKLVRTAPRNRAA